MRSQALPQAESQPPSHWRSVCIACRSARFLASCAAVSLLFAAILTAQTNPVQSNPVPSSATSPSPKHVHPHRKPTPATPAPQPLPPPTPVAPPPPNWPANDQPRAASIVFDSRGLLVVASNSSLTQILNEVSVETGAKVEGLDEDQRIFGTYGPGPARDVIAQLLDGSGYDVLMIGDRGEGTPRRVVLTSRSGNAPKTTATNTPPANDEDTQADEPAPEPQPEPEPPQPAQNGAAPPVPVRTPQQIMQEIQERERQRQNQNMQQNPQN